MNGPQHEIDQRKADNEGLQKLVQDFLRSEKAIVDEAQKLVCEAVRNHFPIIQGSALAAKYYKGKLSLEVLFDLTPGAKSVEVRGGVQPPPVVSIVRKDLRY